MIDEKRLEQEYRKLQKNATPDLWDRIEGRLEKHPERGNAKGQDGIADRNAAEGQDGFADRNVATGQDAVAYQNVAAEQEVFAGHDTIIRKQSGWVRFRHRYGYGITAAAAAIAITVGLNVARNSGNMTMGPGAGEMETTMAGAAEATMAAATEAAARGELSPAESEAMAAETAANQAYGQDGAVSDGAVSGGTVSGGTASEQEVPSPETGRPDSTAAALAEGVVTWQQLAVADYTALAVPERAVTVPEDSWYFSEDILADTGLLCGAGVSKVSFEYDNSGNAVKVVYDLTIDEIYFAEDYVSSGNQIQVKSPIIEAEGDEAFLLYQLQTDSTYLLPLKRLEGTWELLYPFAPQVQVLKEGGYLFHSGYASLMDSTASVVIGQQQAVNDYYYDRMLFRDDDSFLSDFLSLVER